ncbi:MAG: CO dehydrogenase/acetyl-CoA synthase subunit delta [Candidatus Bathyarchaeia archaeon]
MERRKEGEITSIRFGPKLIELLSKFEEIELEDVVMDVGDLEITLQPAVGMPLLPTPRPVAPPVREKPTELVGVEFRPSIMEYPGKIVEVTLGATKGEGGTRGGSITIGGERTPAFYLFEGAMPHPPVISFDVFDTKIPLARAVKMHVRDVLEDPAAWAKRSVEKFGAEMVNLHLVSIDPRIKDTPPHEAAKTVEEVLQAVDVPLSVGGCGDREKDLRVFERIAEVAEGERLLFNSVVLDMDYEGAAKVINEHGHVALAFTSMDMAKARELNRCLYEFLPKNRIIIDTTTAALGYGLDYAFSIMERTRLAGLMGDPDLQHPMASGTTNAWAAREAWMKMAPEWGPRELRGPIWETVTALTLLLTGVDFFMMMHPAAVRTVKDVIGELISGREGDVERAAGWVTMRV